MLFFAAVSSFAAPPQTLALTYEVRFDLGPTGDAVCGMTGICDCTVTWKGEGTLVASAGDRHTYEGRYEKASGGCYEAFELWAPADGRAFHTITLDGQTVREWVAHGRRSASARITSGAKAAGQVWLADMSAPVVDGRVQHQERDSGNAGGIAITSDHRWTATLK